MNSGVVRAITSIFASKVGYRGTIRCASYRIMWSPKHQLHLPKATGPYTPGCVDVMLDYSEKSTFTRLFYPTKIHSIKDDVSKWVLWFGDRDYISGTGKAISVKPWILRLIYWWYSANKVYSPSLYGEKVNTDQKLKCIVISHGYAGSRFLYSIMCNELASRGYLVAVIEHKDQSACHTYYYKTKEDAILDIKTTVEPKSLRIGGKDHYERRNKQVHQRAEECDRLLDFLINLNNGVVPHNILDDVKLHKQQNFKLEDLVGKIDLDSLTIAGHSFGAATALLTMSKRKEFKQGILLDPWMFPIKSETSALENITQPLLFVNTQTFHIQVNVNVMEKYLKKRKDNEMYTILHTTHESQTDAAYVMGHWLNMFMKKLEPLQALTINNALMLKFLKKHTQHEENISDMDAILRHEEQNVKSGLTKPWI